MTRKFRIVWVDDDIADVVRIWGAALSDSLRTRDVHVEIVPWSQGIGVIELAQDAGADLLLLDIKLHGDPQIDTAFQLLEKLRHRGISRPVALLSGYKDRYSRELAAYQGRYLAAFDKSAEGIRALGDFILSYLERPPLTAVVMSDLHVGRITASTKPMERFFGALESAMGRARTAHGVNHLLLLGDFVWQASEADVPVAYELIERARRALGLSKPDSLHLCPGNHDVDRRAERGWTPVYRELVRLLSLHDDGLRLRYVNHVGTLREFQSQIDTVGVGPGATHGVLFASLNSVGAEGGTTIGGAQLSALRNVMSSQGAHDLRIALMHHPLFPSPHVGAGREVAIPDDAAKVCTDLSHLGFELVLTGHSHYSCVHSHEQVVLNSPTRAKPPQRLVVVSLATLGGEPSPGTPFQQFFVLRVGHRTPDGVRRVEVISQVYDPVAEEFSPGESIELDLGVSGIARREAVSEGHQR